MRRLFRIGMMWIGLFVLAIAGVRGMREAALEYHVRGVAPDVRRPAKAVAWAYFVSRFTNDFDWESELFTEAGAVSSLSQADRISFKKYIILHFDMPSYLGVEFMEDVVGRDARALSDELARYDSAEGASLSPEERRSIEGWSDELHDYSEYLVWAFKT